MGSSIPTLFLGGLGFFLGGGGGGRGVQKKVAKLHCRTPSFSTPEPKAPGELLWPVFIRRPSVGLHPSFICQLFT